MTRLAVGVAILAFLTTAASADILEWKGADGVRHYTNLKSEVPSQQATQIVVDEQVWLPQAATVPVVEEQPAAPTEPPPDAEVERLRAYLAGLESGLASSAGTGGDVYVNAPVAVTLPASPPYPGGYVPPGYGWLLPGYYPFVGPPLFGGHRKLTHERFGTSFDGRGFFPKRFATAAGPPPLGAAGPPPLGAAGPPPLGAAGPPPLGAAGPPPLGFVTPFRR